VDFVIIIRKIGSRKNNLGGVGRGVLRFWSARYRKTRSNFGLFWDFYAVSGIGGVDIIYLTRGDWNFWVLWLPILMVMFMVIRYVICYVVYFGVIAMVLTYG